MKNKAIDALEQIDKKFSELWKSTKEKLLDRFREIAKELKEIWEKKLEFWNAKDIQQIENLINSLWKAGLKSAEKWAIYGQTLWGVDITTETLRDYAKLQEEMWKLTKEQTMILNIEPSFWSLEFWVEWGLDIPLEAQVIVKEDKEGFAKIFEWFQEELWKIGDTNFWVELNAEQLKKKLWWKFTDEQIALFDKEWIPIKELSEYKNIAEQLNKIANDEKLTQDEKIKQAKELIAQALALAESKKQQEIAVIEESKWKSEAEMLKDNELKLSIEKQLNDWQLEQQQAFADWQVEILWTQKELETDIIDTATTTRLWLEQALTSWIITETDTRISQYDREMERLRQIIALRQEAWLTVWTPTTAPTVQVPTQTNTPTVNNTSTSTVNNNTNPNVNVNVTVREQVSADQIWKIIINSINQSKKT
jgi:hypothetical protein